MALSLAAPALAQDPSPAGSSGSRFAQWIRGINPKTRLATMDWQGIRNTVSPSRMIQQARTNYREGRFYATDLTEHATWQQALRRSVRPTDLSANVRSAFLKGVHPARIVGNLFDPLTIELQRQIVGGEGLSVSRLVRSLNPVVIGTTMAGSLAGDVAGAAVQSVFAGMGPIGAAAGFLARPLLGFSAQIFSYNVGKSVSEGKSFKQGVAQALRDIRPGRDFGQMIGGVLGGVAGQVLIPIPVVGGIIGGMVGGMVGMVVGNLLENHGPTSRLMSWIKGGLSRLADRIEGKKLAPPPAPPRAPPPIRVVTPAPAATTTVTAPPGPLAARPPTARPAVDSSPNMDDLPLRD